jgi:hypothetical protein
MAQIDPSIALSIRPAQIESPLVSAARAAELQGAQQSQFMNMLKMKEYVDESRTKNAMTKWLSGKTAKDLESDQNINELATKFGAQGLALAKQIDDRRKAQGEAAYREAQIGDLKSQGEKRRYELGESQTKNAINTISGFTNRQQALDMLYDSEANGTIPREAAENIRRMMPDNEEEFPAFKQSLIERLMTADQRVQYGERQRDRTAPKWTARDIGGAIVYVDENPFSETSGQQKAGASLTKTAAPAAVTPSKVVQLQTELASAEKTYGPNSPQVRQIRDEIEQETGGLERQRIAIDRYRSRKGDGSGSSIGPGTKLEKGERWNPDEQRIETVPGSKLYVAQSNAHGKDRSSLVAVETKTNSAINKIDEILDSKNQAGFDANFSGMVPYGGFVTGRFAPDSRRKIESLKADMKSAGLELIRQGGSIGQITEREWPILEAMIAGISPEMTPEAARAEFKKVRAYMNRLKDNAKDAYQTEWGDTQYFKPAPGGNAPRQSTNAPKAPAVGTVQNGYKFKGGNPADQNNWEKVK